MVSPFVIVKWVRCCVQLLVIVTATVLAWPRTADAQAQPDLYELARARSGEPSWSPLMRLRAAAPRFDRDSAGQRSLWLQLLAQAEATFGNYQRALEAWDRLGPPSVGDVEGARRRFSMARRVSVLDTLIAMADTARVIMVNERHHAASDRLLTLQLLPVLYAKGFRYFAAEAFTADTAGPPLPFEVDDDRYISEPVFAEVIREAKRWGYTLVPYEAAGRQFDEPDSLNPQQRRDYAQARNLAASTIARDAQAKVLVHAGYDHIKERATAQWFPMAGYFQALTGIDPVTVDQTSGTERSAPTFAHPVHRALTDSLPAQASSFIDSTGAVIGSSAVMVDLVVIRAGSPLEGGRPAFLAMQGARRAARITVPECRMRHCVLTAHRRREPDRAAVLDRVEVQRRTAVTLFLPNETVRLTLYDVRGTRLRHWNYSGHRR